MATTLMLGGTRPRMLTHTRNLEPFFCPIKRSFIENEVDEEEQILTLQHRSLSLTPIARILVPQARKFLPSQRVLRTLLGDEMIRKVGVGSVLHRKPDSLGRLAVAFFLCPKLSISSGV